MESMKHIIKQWWGGEKVVDTGQYVPYVVTRPPLIRRIYERLPAWAWAAIAVGALQKFGELTIGWMATWW